MGETKGREKNEMNLDGLDLGLGLEEKSLSAPGKETELSGAEEAAKFNKEVAAGVAAKKKAFDKAVAEQVAAEVAEMRKGEEEFTPKIDVDLTAGNPAAKGEKVAIIIDEVDHMPNFEVVSVNGTVYKIQRGKVVKVPISVVHVLENAIKTTPVQTADPRTGEMITHMRDSASIPWRRA